MLAPTALNERHRLLKDVLADLATHGNEKHQWTLVRACNEICDCSRTAKQQRKPR